MSGTTMAFLIVLIVMIAGTIKHFIDRRYPKGEGLPPDAGTQGRIDDLEERVRTLERIATDKGSRLKDEIDAL